MIEAVRRRENRFHISSVLSLRQPTRAKNTYDIPHFAPQTNTMEMHRSSSQAPGRPHFQERGSQKGAKTLWIYRNLFNEEQRGAPAFEQLLSMKIVLPPRRQREFQQTRIKNTKDLHRHCPEHERETQFLSTGSENTMDSPPFRDPRTRTRGIVSIEK